MAKDTGKKLADMMYGQPFDVPTPENLRLGQQLIEQQVREKAARDAKLTPLDKAKAAYEAARMMGSAAVASLGSIPTRISKGSDAGDQYVAERVFIPTTEKGLDYVENVGNFLEQLETKYKIPPILPEAMALQHLTGLATKQATRAAKQKAMQAAKAGERYAERKVPQIMERGGAGADILSGMAEGSQSRIFIGPKAKTWDKGRAAMAEAMEESGRSPEDIWLATGTFRGRDGILRQEIDDRAARFLTDDQRKEIVEGLKGQVGELREQVKPTKQKDLFPKALTEARKEVKTKIGELKEEIQARGKNPSTQGLEAKYIFEHPELYKAYPELADLNITTGGGYDGNTLGSLNVLPRSGDKPGVMDMDIYTPGLKKDPTSISLHEMQHAVQTLEGMGPGGSPTMAFNQPEALDILKRLREDIRKPPSFEEFQRLNKFPEDEAQDAYAQFLKEREKLPIQPKIDRDLQSRAAMEYYKRLAGEAEARAVQDRQLMTPSQRMETPPPASYDVPQEDLIVKPPREYAHGGRVHISDNPDVMQLELASGKKKGGAVSYAEGGDITADDLILEERKL